MLKRCHKKVFRMERNPGYILPPPLPAPDIPPVVVGAGPAGLFAALVLAEPVSAQSCWNGGGPWNSAKPTWNASGPQVSWTPPAMFNLERAAPEPFQTASSIPEPRISATGSFWKHWQHAVGRRTGDPHGCKPHIGTDYLYVTLQNLRRELLSAGAASRFESRLTNLEIQDGALTGITVEGPEGTETLPCRRLILCPGHSARDTFALLHAKRNSHGGKALCCGGPHRTAAGGLRCRPISSSMPVIPAFPPPPTSCPAIFQTVAPPFPLCLPRRRSGCRRVRSGPCCHQRYEQSPRARENINGALLVNVTPEDFGSDSPLAGVAFQRQLEEAAYALGGGGFYASRAARGGFSGPPSLPRPRPHPSQLSPRRCLDRSSQLSASLVSEALEQALPLLGRKLRGYDHPDAVLTAVESRSSSPVRILRDACCQSL